MRYLFLFLSFVIHADIIAQDASTSKTRNDSLLIVAKNPSKGFHYDYILFIPKGMPLAKKTFLLVEPNNTGKLSDSMELHKKYAIDLASVSSVGNNISTELRIPLLVPVFPRPASRPLMYTHALDRDIMVDKEPGLQRLDLQLIAMIADAKNVLRDLMIPVEDKFFMNGFSASGTFANRFSFMHPEMIEALAIGGFNGKLMIPQKEIKGIKLNYPLGINDFVRITGDSFRLNAYRQVPQFIYLGKLDDNDAVQFDDAYNEEERKIINEHLGSSVQERYLECQKIYKANNINATFRTFEDVGHWTTGAVNLEVIQFFLARMKAR